MSVVGLDFGSHAASIALWYEDTDKVEVIADDLGFRTIPCAVAFRAGEESVEVLTGQAAVSQAHKNAKNTFLDIRSLLLDETLENVTVPALDKEISVKELATHFFRNIHNQIKNQVGKAVRDCIFSVPEHLNVEGPARSRMIEAAKDGGCRVKSTILDSASVLNAHDFDNEMGNPEQLAVIDLGWTNTTVTIYNVSSGLYFPKGSVSTTEMSGSVMVKALATHCSKDFMRKAKFPCDDNTRAMTRLRKECEDAMKTLSTGSEAMIDIDSLCEGVDYSCKISKARFEDLGSIPIIQLKQSINGALEKAGVAAGDITKVVMAGGLSGMPKCNSTAKALFPSATFHRTRGVDMNEAQAVGAAMQAKHLIETQLIDAAPAGPVNAVKTCTSEVSLSSGDGAAQVIFPAGTALPARYTAKGGFEGAQGHLKVMVGGSSVGDVVFNVEGSDKVEIAAVVTIDVSGRISVEVTQAGADLIIGNLEI